MTVIVPASSEPAPEYVPMRNDSTATALGGDASGSASTVSTAAHEHYFGYFACTPQWLQRLHTSRFLLCCLCWCSIVQGFIVNGHIPAIISTLELRFNLSSTQMGLLAVMYDIAVLVCLIPVGTFGQHGHKGRYLGTGMLVIAVGAFLCLLPQFATGNYKVDQTTANKTCLVNSSESCVFDQQQSDEADALRNWYYVFLIGNFLVGVGGSPLWTLGITYLDENVSQRSSPLFLAIYNASGAVGPALGFILGGALLKIYGDPGVDWQTILPAGNADARWYGAWWIGFILAGVGALVFAMPMLAFARQLPEAKKHRLKDVDQSNKRGEKPTEVIELTGHIKDMPRECLALGRNMTYVALTLAQTCEVFVTNGTITFLPKLLENMFAISTAKAGILVGAVMVPGAVVGQVAGGALLRQIPLQVRAMLLSSAACMTCAFLLTFSFLLQCPEIPIAGVNLPYTTAFNDDVELDYSAVPSAVHACNRNCGCDNLNYEPMCNAGTGVSYVHPCRAGCTRKMVDGLTKTYTSCSCVYGNDSRPALDTVLQPGVCASQCANNLYLFLGLVFVYIVIKFVAFQPIQQAQLRSVRFELRTMAITVSWIVMRLLGTIPGGIVFGWAIDGTCVYHRVDCNGKQLACLRYNAQSLSKAFLTLTACGKSITIMLLLVGAYFYRGSAKTSPSERQLRRKDTTDTLSPVVRKDTSASDTLNSVNRKDTTFTMTAADSSAQISVERF